LAYKAKSRAGRIGFGGAFNSSLKGKRVACFGHWKEAIIGSIHCLFRGRLINIVIYPHESLQVAVKEEMRQHGYIWVAHALFPLVRYFHLKIMSRKRCPTEGEDKAAAIGI
jgi:hypothetical protein